MCKPPRPQSDVGVFCSTDQAGRPEFSANLAGAWFKCGARERRTRPRSVSVRFTWAEREDYRGMVRAAASCGNQWRSFVGAIAGPRGVVESRLVMMTRCGTRICTKCGHRARELRAKRCQGPWTLFFTLTLPHSGMSLHTSWALIHRWIRIFTEKLRSQFKSANPFGLTSKRLQYAWAIEPHKDHYPHVHFVATISFIPRQTLLMLWNETTGFNSVNLDVRKVYSIDGICHYLSKYISKAQFPDELYGLIHRQRLWACTLTSPKRPKGDWRIDERLDSSFAISEHERCGNWGKAAGWEKSAGIEGRFAIWSRVWGAEELLGVEDVPIWVQECSFGSRYPQIRAAIRAASRKRKQKSFHIEDFRKDEKRDRNKCHCGADWHEICPLADFYDPTAKSA